MNDKEILNFKTQIQNFSKEEILKQREEIQDKISKMILNSDLIIKAALLEARFEELNKEPTNNG